jgi:hypothetical protein
MTATFTPDFLARPAEQLGWNGTPSGQAKRQEVLALLQELANRVSEEHVTEGLGNS